MGIEFEHAVNPVIVLKELLYGETFRVLNNGNPCTQEVKADDIYIVVNERHYAKTNAAKILNLRTGCLHCWRGDLHVRRVSVTATAKDI